MDFNSKRLRLSFGTSQGQDAENVWHSTAISDNLEIVDSPRLASVPTKKSPRRKGIDQNQRAASPVIITEPSGHFIFSAVLQKHGFFLGTPRNKTKVDAMIFRKTLSDWIQECNKGDEDTQAESQKFINDMKSYLNVKENLIQAMTPTLHAQEIYQPSLLHCLLGVMPLQRDILSLLSPILVDIGYNCSDSEHVVYLNMILNQLKWLPELVDGGRMTDDLLEVLLTCNAKAQTEMIRYLPDIIPESFHSKISAKLLNLLENFSPLCSSLMECFSVIDISDDDLNSIRTTAVENMQMVEPKDYTAFFAFLFRSENPEVLRNVISDLREKFTFEISGTDNNMATITVDIVDKIRFCISINDQIVSTWIKILKDEVSFHHELFQSIDLAMLLIFLDSHSKVVESQLKLLLPYEEEFIKLVEDVLKNCPTIADPIFSAFSKYLERILWSKETRYYSVATKILVKLFAAASDYNAQQVVGTFTSVLAHGHLSCRDHVIGALNTMANDNILKVLRFMPLIMGAMDYIVKFSPSQVRALMKILATAANIPNNRESVRFESEFSILLRKQLTHSDIQIKCVGVIGSVATLDQLVQQGHLDFKIQGLVDFVWHQVERQEDACWIYFDEMAVVVSSQNVPIEILQGLKDLMTERFLTNWTLPIANLPDDHTDSTGMKLKDILNGNSEIEADALAIHFLTKTLKMSPLVIAAHTRFLCVLANKTDGSLEEIDIIIGCPLILPPLALYTSTSALKCFTFKQKSDMATYFLLAINFFREIVSAFCTQTDPELKIKIWMRLTNLVSLQHLLITFISEHLSAMSSLPFAYALERTARGSQFLGERKRAGPKEKKEKTTKKKAPPKDKDKSLDSDIDDDDDDQPGPSSRKPRKKAAPRKKKVATAKADTKDFGDEIHPNNFVPYFRRFDTNVFLLLSTRFEVKTPEDSFTELLVSVANSQAPNNLVKTAEVLTPQTLVLLLRDLNHQIENSHICIIQNIQMGFPKDLFMCLCDLLDTLFRASTLPMSSDLEKEVDASFRYLYCTLGHYFEKVKQRKYKPLLDKAVNLMIARGEVLESDLIDEEKFANYLGGFPNCFMSSSTAVEQLKLMKTVYGLVEEEMQSFVGSKIEENANIFLRRDWKLASVTVQMILKTWLTTTDTTNTLQALSNLSHALISSNPDDGIPLTDNYKSCTVLNFHTWYRVIIETLAQFVHKHVSPEYRRITDDFSTKKSKSDEDVDDLIPKWNQAFAILKILVSVVKQNRKPLIITQLLKNTRIFLEAFINNGIKLLPLVWSRDTNQAKKFIRNLQAPARKIQYVCEHCKVEKSTQLMRHVPLVKKALETLVFRVRGVVTIHDASAFWMGSLKHRNLDGEIINSEPFESSEDEEQEDEDSDNDSAENDQDLFEDPGDDFDEDD